MNVCYWKKEKITGYTMSISSTSESNEVSTNFLFRGRVKLIGCGERTWMIAKDREKVTAKAMTKQLQTRRAPRVRICVMQLIRNAQGGKKPERTL